jgi:competence protein ComEC
MILKFLKRIAPFILGVLLLANILAWLTVYELSQPQILKISFFDVGQGDSIFIQTPQGHQVLIDGGPDSTVLEKLGQEMPFWDRDIDLIILTHPDHDHIAGLIEVLKVYEVDNILWTGVAGNTQQYGEWERCLEEENASIIIAESGQKIIMGDVYFEVIYPFENLEGEEVKNINDTSVVGRLVFKNNSFFFTGDISKSAERKIVESGAEIKSDVLKVSHHGSKTSTAEEFVFSVSPDLAVIQVGRDNSYGHPYQEVLDTLDNYGIKILRTDIHGDIEILSDGLNYVIK